MRYASRFAMCHPARIHACMSVSEISFTSNERGRKRHKSLQLRPAEHTSTVNDNVSAIQMARRPRAQVNNSARNILRFAQSLVGVGVCKSLYASRQCHQPVRHLGGEESRSNAVAKNTARPKLDGQVTSEMQRCCFRGTVTGSGVFTQRTYPNARHRSCHKNTGRLFKGCLLLEKWSEPAYTVSTEP